MIEVKIPKIFIIRAERLAEELGALRNSIKKGEGNVYGFLGELLVQREFGGELKNTYDYDLITNKGFTVDVKTKIIRTAPRPDYYCNVPDYNTEQKCDFYFFTRIMEDFSCGWLLGWIKKEEFFKLAKFRKKGEIDPMSDYGWRFRADCYNILINQLHLKDNANKS